MNSADESDKAVLALLRMVNELYAENQHGAKSMRRGFLTMAKARQSMGRGALSALDCREKMIAQMTVEKDEGADLPVTVDTLESSTLWHRHRGVSATQVPKSLRRRAGSSINGGGGASTNDGTTAGNVGNADSIGGYSSSEDVGSGWTDSDHSPDSSADEAKDSMLLFGGLVPPAMRQSKQDFTNALEHYVMAANVVHRIVLAEKQVRSIALPPLSSASPSVATAAPSAPTATGAAAKSPVSTDGCIKNKSTFQ